MYNMKFSIGSHKIKVEVLVLILIVLFLAYQLYYSVPLMEGLATVSKKKPVTSKPSSTHHKKEGFVGSNNVAYGPEFESSKATPSTGVTAIWNRDQQPIPLPKNELDIFATTPFKPECCPNTYSNSTGCACMTVGQYNYIKGRGGNNVPYSEY
jgi:hypothetical protein